jgi:hypothetical protein
VFASLAHLVLANARTEDDRMIVQEFLRESIKALSKSEQRNLIRLHEAITALAACENA